MMNAQIAHRARLLLRLCHKLHRLIPGSPGPAGPNQAPIRLACLTCTSSTILNDMTAERLPTGFHAAATDRAETRVDLQARFVPHPHATFLVTCASDALLSQAIRRGDLCIVDRSLDPKHGDLVIATTSDDVLVRRLDMTPGRRPRLIADPPTPTLEVDGEAGIEIWGVVSSIVRAIR